MYKSKKDTMILSNTNKITPTWLRECAGNLRYCCLHNAKRFLSHGTAYIQVVKTLATPIFLLEQFLNYREEIFI